MKKTFMPVLAALAAAAVLAQNRTLDWISYGADPQRTGWAKGESAITRDDVKDFQLLWKLKLAGSESLTPPVIIARLISYRGFKELAFVGATSDFLYALNADLGRIFFEKQLTYSSDIPKVQDASWPCGAGVTTMAMLPPAPERGSPRGRGASPYSGGFGAPRLVLVLSSDGRLHRLNTANGDEPYPPVRFLPPNARPSALNMAGETVYTTTNQGCGGVADAIWALDLGENSDQVASFPSKDGFWGLGGVAIGSGGTVYAQASTKLLALSPKDLKLEHEFTPPDLDAAPRKNVGLNSATPVVFSYQGRDLVVASGRDGRLYVLDADATSLSRTVPISPADADANDRGIFGSLASWEGAAGTRWVLASVWGPLSADLGVAPANGPAAHGSIVAFKLEEREGKPVLAPAWVSRDMHSPMPPVIANGVVFGLSAGEFTREVKASWNGPTVVETPKPGTHAILYALDATTGQELFSSGNRVTAPAALTGLTAANGRAYFGTADGTFYAFGLYMEH